MKIAITEKDGTPIAYVEGTTVKVMDGYDACYMTSPQNVGKSELTPFLNIEYESDK